MKALGTALLILGALMLILPLTVAIWAHHNYTIGIAIESVAALAIWCGLAVMAIGLGGWLRFRRR